MDITDEELTVASRQSLGEMLHEAIKYLEGVELTNTPIRIDKASVQLKPKEYFENTVPLVRKLWGDKSKMFEIYAYHLIRFRRAVEAYFASGCVTDYEPKKEPRMQLPTKKPAASSTATKKRSKK